MGGQILELESERMAREIQEREARMLIKLLQKNGKTRQQTLNELMEECSLSEEEAEVYMKRYWQ